MRQLFQCWIAWKRRLQSTLWLSLALIVLVGQLFVADPAIATGVYQMPAISAGDSTWMVDEADVLSRINQGKINSQLKKLAQDTGNEVRLVTVRRLDYGETIGSFTQQLFESWYPEQTDRDHQVLLVLDTLTNNVAIETGNAVKSLLSDEVAESVASETVLIPIRQANKYNEAFLGASERLATVLSGKADPGPPKVEEDASLEGTFTAAEETDASSATVLVVVLLIVATVIPMATYYWYVR